MGCRRPWELGCHLLAAAAVLLVVDSSGRKVSMNKIKLRLLPLRVNLPQSKFPSVTACDLLAPVPDLVGFEVNPAMGIVDPAVCVADRPVLDEVLVGFSPFPTIHSTSVAACPQGLVDECASAKNMCISTAQMHNQLMSVASFDSSRGFTIIPIPSTPPPTCLPPPYKQPRSPMPLPSTIPLNHKTTYAGNVGKLLYNYLEMATVGYYKISWFVTANPKSCNHRSSHVDAFIRVEHRPPSGLPSVSPRFGEGLHVRKCLGPVKLLRYLRLRAPQPQVPRSWRLPEGPPESQAMSTNEAQDGCYRRGRSMTFFSAIDTAGPRRRHLPLPYVILMGFAVQTMLSYSFHSLALQQAVLRWTQSSLYGSSSVARKLHSWYLGTCSLIFVLCYH